jgi:hypothetical protein
MRSKKPAGKTTPRSKHGVGNPLVKAQIFAFGGETFPPPKTMEIFKFVMGSFRAHSALLTGGNILIYLGVNLLINIGCRQILSHRVGWPRPIIYFTAVTYFLHTFIIIPSEYELQNRCLLLKLSDKNPPRLTHGMSTRIQ